jgi:hypothetical protein
MKLKCLWAAVLLIAAAGSASAQDHGPYWGYGPKARGYYGTPYNGGPQYGDGGDDQYGYGPGYSYGRQAPSQYYVLKTIGAKTLRKCRNAQGWRPGYLCAWPFSRR